MVKLLEPITPALDPISSPITWLYLLPQLLGNCYLTGINPEFIRDLLFSVPKYSYM